MALGSSLRVFGRSVVERLIRLVGPSIAVLAGFMPDLVAIAFDPRRAEVSRIFVEELFPFHYKPLAYTASIQKLMAWLALGSAGATAFWSQSRSGRTAGICLIALTVTSCVPVLASAWWPESSLTRLFPWRLTPFAVLVAQLLFASALVGGYVGLPNARQVFWSTWRSLLSLVCLAVLAVGYTEKLDRVIIGSCMAAIAVTWLVQIRPGRRLGSANRRGNALFRPCRCSRVVGWDTGCQHRPSALQPDCRWEKTQRRPTVRLGSNDAS